MAGRGAATPHDALIRRIGPAKCGNQANGRFRARFCPGKNAVGPVIQRSPNRVDRKRFQRVLKPPFFGRGPATAEGVAAVPAGPMSAALDEADEHQPGPRRPGTRPGNRVHADLVPTAGGARWLSRRAPGEYPAGRPDPAGVPWRAPGQPVWWSGSCNLMPRILIPVRRPMGRAGPG